MKNSTNVLAENKLKSYLYVGIVNTIVGLSIFPILYFVLFEFNFHYLQILTGSYIISVLFAYMTNKIYVFKTSGNYISELFKFSTYHVIVYLFNIIILPALVYYLSLHPVIAQYMFAIPVILFGYLWQSKITFKAED